MNSVPQIVTFFILLNSHSEGVKLSFQHTNGVICQDPGTPEHASREDNLKTFLPGMDIIFTCEFTYRLLGSQIRTCRANGTWSGVQPVCEKYMCDELDAEAPKYGKRIGDAFTIGSELTFICSSNYNLKGEKKLKCLPSGEWSAEPPTCHHRCEEVKCDTGEKCIIDGKSTKCVCRDNMDCSSRMDPVCGSDGQTYNNECIMNATACRNNKKIRNVQRGSCIPGDICSIIPISNCRASFSMFYYNVDKKVCKQIIAGGCHPSGWNGFWTKRDCKQHCMKDVCSLKPDFGPCDASETRWYFDAGTKTCEQFLYGGCFGNPNNFRTKNDCDKRCN